MCLCRQERYPIPMRAEKVEGPAENAGPRSRWITEGLKQRRLSPSGGDESPPERVSDPAGVTESEGIWEPVPPPQPSGLPEPAGGFATARTAAKCGNSEWQTILSVIVNDKTFL